MKRLLPTGILLAVVGAAAAYWTADAGPEGPRWRTAPVERGDLVTAVTAAGTLQAVTTVEVSSQLSGQVSSLEADFNDEVREGQPLARLDPETFEARVRELEAEAGVARTNVAMERAALSRATADLANARAALEEAEAEVATARARFDDAGRDLERKRILRERGTLSERDLEKAETEHRAAEGRLRAAQAQGRVKQAAVKAARASVRMAKARIENAQATVAEKEAALRQAEIDLERTVIRAPIDGVVIRRNVDLGQTVAASLQAPTLFTIAKDLRRMEVKTYVDEADIGRIHPGQEALFTVDAYSERTFRGRVEEIRKAPQVVQNVVTYAVVVATENADLALLPGMTAAVRVVTARRNDTLIVPNAALRVRPPGVAPDAKTGPGRSVWALPADGHLKRIAVETGVTDGARTEIIAGDLSEGEHVLVGHEPEPENASWFGLRFGL